MTIEDVTKQIKKYAGIVGRSINNNNQDRDFIIVGFGVKPISNNDFELYVISQNEKDERRVFETTLQTWIANNQ